MAGLERQSHPVSIKYSSTSEPSFWSINSYEVGEGMPDGLSLNSTPKFNPFDDHCRNLNSSRFRQATHLLRKK